MEKNRVWPADFLVAGRGNRHRSPRRKKRYIHSLTNTDISLFTGRSGRILGSAIMESLKLS